MRHTKIIATVGPASDSDAMIDALIAAGTDIFRLNFSHGTHDSHAATFERIRAAAQRARRVVAVLQDLGGPKIRTGPLEGRRPLVVTAGSALAIATGDFVGRPGRISTTFDGLAKSVHPGDRLLLADGMVELRVDSADGREIKTTVIEGGQIGEHKGINAPGVPLPTSAITPKDVDDLAFGLSLGVDLVALSFVQTADDLRRGRQLLRDARAGDVPLVAKLERPQALAPAIDPLPFVRRPPTRDHAQAICEAAVTLSTRGEAAAIVAVTRGGGTARRLSALRPRAPIIATTDRDDTARRLAIYHGVAPLCTEIGENVDAVGTLIAQQLVARGLVAAGATVVLVSIRPDLARRDANYLTIQRP